MPDAERVAAAPEPMVKVQPWALAGTALIVDAIREPANGEVAPILFRQKGPPLPQLRERQCGGRCLRICHEIGVRKLALWDRKGVKNEAEIGKVVRHSVLDNRDGDGGVVGNLRGRPEVRRLLQVQRADSFVRRAPIGEAFEHENARNVVRSSMVRDAADRLIPARSSGVPSPSRLV